MTTTTRVFSVRDLLMPAVGSGLLMALYLLLRPYGDSPGEVSSPQVQAEAFASTWWVVAHVCGALALVMFAWLALRLADVDRTSFTARVARWSGLAGAVLVLPYYGAETFALHVIGSHAAAGQLDLLTLVPDIRNQPAAITMFGLGLVLLAVSGVAVALTWARRTNTWLAWPLGIAIALVLPQFYLPPVGRMAFGVAYLAAAALFAWSVVSVQRVPQPVG